MENSLIKTARKILHMQENLHPVLFDNQGMMHEEIREKFLKIADFFIKKNLSRIQGLKVKDICLVGSSASYLYREDSDFDVRIITDLSACPAVKNDKTAWGILQRLLAHTFYGQHMRFSVGGINVDFKNGNDNNYVMGNYSILNNQWLIKPRADLPIDKITVQELIQGYYKETAEMYEALAETAPQNGIYSEEEIMKLNRINQKLFEAENKVRKNVDTGLISFLIFKLFRKQGNLRILSRIISQSVNNRLSLK